MTQTLDIRVDTGWQRHPKTKELKAELGLEGPWALLALWGFARHYHPDGNLAGKSDSYIEDAADWKGKAGALIDALLRIRYITGAQNARKLHDWNEHQSWAVGTDERQYNGRLAALIKHGRTRVEAEKILKRNKKKTVRAALRTAMPGASAADCAAECGKPADRSAPLPSSPLLSLPKKNPPTPQRFDPAEIPLPDWLPREVWAGWCEDRRERKKPITKRAASGHLSKLAEFRSRGFDPRAVIQASIDNGWQGIFEPKKSNGAANGTDDPYMESLFKRAGVS